MKRTLARLGGFQNVLVLMSLLLSSCTQTPPAPPPDVPPAPMTPVPPFDATRSAPSDSRTSPKAVFAAHPGAAGGGRTPTADTR